MFFVDIRMNKYLKALPSVFGITGIQWPGSRKYKTPSFPVNFVFPYCKYPLKFLTKEILFRKQNPEYVRVIVRTYTSRNRPTGLFGRVVYEASRDAYASFADALYKALPEVPPDVVRTRINLAVVAAGSFLLNAWLVEGLEDLSGQSIDEEIIFDHVVDLIEHGIEGEKKPGF